MLQRPSSRALPGMWQSCGRTPCSTTKPLPRSIRRCRSSAADSAAALPREPRPCTGQCPGGNQMAPEASRASDLMGADWEQHRQRMQENLGDDGAAPEGRGQIQTSSLSFPSFSFFLFFASKKKKERETFLGTFSNSGFFCLFCLLVTRVYCNFFYQCQLCIVVLKGGSRKGQGEGNHNGKWLTTP